jgi:hypothetical protein
MKQAIAGVTPSEVAEVTVMTVWPSVSVFALGRFHGWLYGIKTGFYIFTIGNLFCLLTIPGALALYFLRLAPWIGRYYAVTNRRVIEYRSQFRRQWTRIVGLPWPFRFQHQVVSKAVELDRFNSIEIRVRPGQEWYHAGDLIFRQGNVETFRLEAVSRPEAFRQLCLNSRHAYAGVKAALTREAVHA